MPRRRTLTIVLAALAPALAACGPQRATIRGDSLNLRLSEYRLQPQDVRIHAGRVNIVARNDGVLTHNIKVEAAGQTDEQGDPIVVGGTRTAQPGGTVRTTILNLPPGRYRLVCTIANHQDLGQYGSLVASK